MIEYPKIELKIKKTLGGGEIILRDERIDEVLKKMQKNGSHNFFNSLIEELGKESERKYTKEGAEIQLILLEILGELKMCALSLYLYEEHKHRELNIPVEVHAYGRENLIEGVPYWDYQKIHQIYGHGFVYSLHKISQYLRMLGNKKDAPQLPKKTRGKIEKIRKKFETDFEGLNGVRNSWQHKEDRIRGVAKNSEDNNSKIKIPGKLHIIGSWFDNHIVYTNDDGTTSKLEVSRKSFDALQSHIQDVFDVIDWVEGGSDLDPSIKRES